MPFGCGLKDRQKSTEPTGMQGDPTHHDLTLGSAALGEAALDALLDEHFDGRPGLRREFPLLSPSKGGRSVVWRHGGEPVAHAAWRPLGLVLGDERIRAVGIGLVTTHARFRGRGLATALVEQCVEQARGEGADLALLFGAVRRLYTRLGFMPAGRERTTRIVSQPGAEFAKGVRTAVPSEAKTLHALLERHPLRVERTAEEFAQLLAVPDTRAHVLEGRRGIEAYCVEGKGRDLQGVLHEWAGEPRAVDALLQSIAVGGPRFVLSPSSLAPPTAGEHHLGHLALVRVLRPDSIGSADPTRAFGDARGPGLRDMYVWGLDSV